MDKKTEKNPSDLKRLFGYAGNFRFLTVASIILSAVSAVMALAPFLKDSPIILMDEATASLDVENETMIQESLSRAGIFIIICRRHISHLRSKYFTSKIFHSFQRNEFH